MKTKLPIPLTNNIMGTLSIDVTIPQNMQMLAMAQGTGPEEQANLVNQKIQEVIQAVSHLLPDGADFEL